jgi:hypothetical protein
MTMTLKLLVKCLLSKLSTETKGIEVTNANQISKGLIDILPMNLIGSLHS